MEVHEFMGSWFHRVMTWVHGSCVHRLMGSWVHRFMGSWVFMGSWGWGCMLQAFWVTEQVQVNHCSFDPMIQNMILPQIGLAQEQNINKNTSYRETTVFWKRNTGRPPFFSSHVPKYYYLKFSMWLKTLQNGMTASDHISINFQCQML